MSSAQQNRSMVLALLRASLPEDSLITDAAGLRPYETDGLTAIREMPWLVVLPETEAQVVAILRICRENDVSVVPRGAGTGLSGGARPHEDGVVLGLSKMHGIIEIDPLNCTARVQPGVRNLAISEAVAEHGLYYAPDPSSQIACSIGGNVAENSGGVHCLKYGLTVNNVSGVRIAMSSGEVLELGGSSFDSPGLDLLAVICGSEGMLGVITEVTVRLLPKPEYRVVMLAAFHSIGSGADAVARIIADGIIPAGMEMMDQLAVTAAEAYAHAGYPSDAASILLIELDGCEEELDATGRRVKDVLAEAGAYRIDEAHDELDQARLWKGRKSAFPAVGRIGPDYYCMDGTIPRANLAQVLHDIAALSDESGLQIANVFHAGDGNLHPLILFDANVPGQTELAAEVGGRILRLCVYAGGTVTGEHGVGVEKLDDMCVQFSSAELEQFFALKRAMDPAGILNPGKGIPTLTRCGELGGMHVRDGQLPHADLERF
jgi:glycolate oxidase